MKKLILLITFCAITACTGPVKKDSKPDPVPFQQIGWIDEDTYTVKVTDVDEKQAIKTAQHKILKDIVEVRLRNKSRYTDIVKIKEEFDSPLSNGVVVYRKNLSDGIMIYFQIRDKGLRNKFQRR